MSFEKNDKPNCTLGCKFGSGFMPVWTHSENCPDKPVPVEELYQAHLADIDSRFGDYAWAKGYLNPTDAAVLRARAAEAETIRNRALERANKMEAYPAMWAHYRTDFVFQLCSMLEILKGHKSSQPLLDLAKIGPAFPVVEIDEEFAKKAVATFRELL